MGAYLVIEAGVIRRVAHEGEIDLPVIYSAVGSPFDVGLSIAVNRRRHIDFLVNDEGLFKYQATRELPPDDPEWRRWGMTFIRPTDGSPLVGPMMICAVNTRRGQHVALTNEEAALYFQAFVTIGHAVPEDAEAG